MWFLCWVQTSCAQQSRANKLSKKVSRSCCCFLRQYKQFYERELAIYQGWVKTFAIFWHITWPKLLKLWLVPVVICRVMANCALPHSVRDLKATRMNVWRCLLREPVLNEFELSHNVFGNKQKIFVAQKLKSQLITEQ